MGLVRGRVLSGGAPVERAIVALWAATAVAPVQLGRAVTGADGGFTIDSAAASAKDASLYLMQRVANPPLIRRAATTTAWR